MAAEKDLWWWARPTFCLTWDIFRAFTGGDSTTSGHSDAASPHYAPGETGFPDYSAECSIVTICYISHCTLLRRVWLCCICNSPSSSCRLLVRSLLSLPTARLKEPSFLCLFLISVCSIAFTCFCLHKQLFS